jgi:hypothetical protein
MEAQDATARAYNSFFGEPWPSGVCMDDDDNYVLSRQAPVPVGESCLLCVEPIETSDRGTFVFGKTGRLCPVHVECMTRAVAGGIGHIENHAYWCKAERDPDGGRSYRQSALEVWAWIAEHGMPPLEPPE